LVKPIKFGEIKVDDVVTIERVLDCLNRNWISSGKYVKEFEKKWGELFGYRYNRAVSSGTDAVLNLVLSLYEFGAKPGDEVVVPALSFIATTNAVRMAGFTPVFVDVDLQTMNMNPYALREVITDRTVAILAVHTMGKPCRINQIWNEVKHQESTYNRRIRIFEDCCEAHGARFDGDYVGKFTDGAAFSFYTAHLICAGEGGMVSTQNHVVDVIVTGKQSSKIRILRL